MFKIICQEADQIKSEENDSSIVSKLSNDLRKKYLNGIITPNQSNDENMLSEMTNLRQRINLNRMINRLILINSLIPDDKMSKRSFQKSTEYKGKRINGKNLFASGLQGILILKDYKFEF